MIVTVLGGSSQSTPGLLEYLNSQPKPQRFCVRLIGRNSERLAAVGRACRLIAPNIQLELYQKHESEKGLDGSHLVIVQVRIGEYQGRERDEYRAIRYNTPGDESLGLGGFSAAVRTWPVLRQLFTTVRRCAPAAIPLLLTSPSGLLIRIAGLEWPDWPVYGICELPYTTLKRLCDVTGTNLDEVTFSYTGLNHLGFLHNIRHGERDILSSYGANDEIPFIDFVRRWRAVPLKYFALYSRPAQVLQAQRGSEPRARVLMGMQQQAMAAYRCGDAKAIRQSLGMRNAEWYQEAVGPLLLALTGAAIARPFFLTVREPDGTVRERAFTVDRWSFNSYPDVRAPEPVEVLTRTLMEYEQAAAHAIWVANPGAMKMALRMHPWLPDLDVDRFVDEVVAEELSIKINSEARWAI